jgi:hypothetical protein
MRPRDKLAQDFSTGHLRDLLWPHRPQCLEDGTEAGGIQPGKEVCALEQRASQAEGAQGAVDPRKGIMPTAQRVGRWRGGMPQWAWNAGQTRPHS